MTDSGGAAYERLVWQLGFPIVEVFGTALAAALLCNRCLYGLTIPFKGQREQAALTQSAVGGSSAGLM